MNIQKLIKSISYVSDNPISQDGIRIDEIELIYMIDLNIDNALKPNICFVGGVAIEYANEESGTETMYKFMNPQQTNDIHKLLKFHKYECNEGNYDSRECYVYSENALNKIIDKVNNVQALDQLWKVKEVYTGNEFFSSLNSVELCG